MRLFHKVLALLLVLTALPAAAQVIPAGYDVGRWRGFRTAVVSYTFDDGTPGHLGIVVPLFDEFGYKTTLFTVTGWSPDWTGLAAAAARGHEVASHTVTHPNLPTIAGSAQMTEMGTSHDAIASRIPTPTGQTVAYPYCAKGNEVATNLYYFAARGCQGAIVPPTPSDFLNISSIVIGTEGSVKTAADLNTRVRSAESSTGWAVFLVHGVDSDGGWSPFSSADLRAHLGFIKDNDATFWVETFGNVVRYIKERNGARITELTVGDQEITLRLFDFLADGTYNYPLSLRRELPTGWTDATVRQAGRVVPSRIVHAGGQTFAEFDVVPDGGDIAIEKIESTGYEGFDGPGSSEVLGTWPNPALDRVTLDFRVARAGQVSLDVYDLLGRRVETVFSGWWPEGRYSRDWDTDAVQPGQYVVRLTTATGVAAGVVVVL